jgi:hypothetical protein
MMIYILATKDYMDIWKLLSIPVETEMAKSLPAGTPKIFPMT